MKIIQRLKEDKVNISFEIFPPKTDVGIQSVLDTGRQIAELNPAFISVTYGAGGGTSKNTVEIASHIKHNFGVESLAHLTCASSTKEEVRKVVASLQKEGIENILALRGDIPDQTQFPVPDQYKYAYELIQDIRQQGDFCIGAACYPSGESCQTLEVMR